MGEVSDDSLNRRQATQWLTEARTLAVETRHLGEEIDDLGLGKRFSVGSERAVGRAILEQHALLQQTSDHVNTIARASSTPPRAGRCACRTALGQLLSSTGEAFELCTLSRSIAP